MIFGTPTATFILIHVIISLIGIATGFVVLYGLLTNRLFAGWTALFLVFNVLTDLTDTRYRHSALIRRVWSALFRLCYSLWQFWRSTCSMPTAPGVGFSSAPQWRRFI